MTRRFVNGQTSFLGYTTEELIVHNELETVHRFLWEKSLKQKLTSHEHNHLMENKRLLRGLYIKAQSRARLGQKVVEEERLQEKKEALVLIESQRKETETKRLAKQKRNNQKRKANKNIASIYL